MATQLELDSPAQLVGQELQTFVVAGERAEVQRNIEAALRGGDSAQAQFPAVERELRTCRGNALQVELSALRLSWRGEPAILVTTNDISSRKNLEHKLREADRLASVGTLAAGVAHEVNNPLAYVIANLAFAEQNLGPSTPLDVLEAVREAHEGVERVRQVVSDLKTFTRHDAQMLPVGLRKLIHGTAKIAAADIRHRARLEIEIATDSLVLANESRLSQVFLNLLLNACHAIPDGAQGLIRVSAKDVGSEMVAEVSDNGVGIPAAILDRVLDPFFTTKPIGIGSGLGLSVCKNIIEGYGGRIELQSAEGRGTTARLFLPIHQITRALEPSPRAQDQPRRTSRLKRKVLAIDDDPMVLRSLKRVLRTHDLTLASSGQAALEVLSEREDFDVILCDLMMPGVTGMDVYEHLLESAPETARRIVFLSGGAVTEHAKRVLRQAPNRRFEKPLTPSELQAIVNEASTD